MNVAKFTPLAEQDLRELVAFIARDNEDAASRVYAAALDAADFLADNPAIGKTITGAGAQYREVRWYVLPRFRNYMLFYIPSSGGIVVLRVLHAARDWRRFF